jgi:hypothetical protein
MSDKKTIRDRVVDPGYRLPEVINPGDTLCIRVYVPKDSLYLAAFWAQYESLGMWLAWERGGTRAKQAADLWKVAIKKARDINDCAEGDCGIMDVRQKPDEPCTLQKLDDCSSQWVDFAYTQLCAPKMRITGSGSIEQWNGTDWIPVDSDEGTGGAYEPGHDINNQIAHYNPPPEGQDGKCLAAINAITYLEAAINFAMVELKELPYLVRLVDSILTTWYWRVFNFAAFTLSMVTGIIWSMTWEQAHKLMSDKSLTNEDDIIAASISDMLCTFYDAYESDGTMTEASFDTLMGNLQDAIDSETPNSPRSLKLEWLMLLAFPGPTWLANISNNAGITEYDCDDCTGWEQVWDFTLSDCGWTAQIAINEDDPTGTWVSGQGWQSTYGDGNGQNSVFIECPDWPSPSVSFYYYSVELYCNVDNGLSELWEGDGYVLTIDSYWPKNENYLSEHTGERVMYDALRLFSRAYPPPGNVWIRKLTMRGTDEVNPFE